MNGTEQRDGDEILSAGEGRRQGDIPLSRNEKILIVGVGSRMRGDDSVGPHVVDLLKERLGDDDSTGRNISLIDADVMPENFTRPIRESGADVCLLVDAVDLKLPPGEIRRVPGELIDETIPCSHSLPLSYIMEYIGEKIDTVELVGIQIRGTGLYMEMSEEAARGAENLVEILLSKGWRELPVYRKGEGKEEGPVNYCW
ncbi:MAG: hypothetical protein DRN57_08530 [Thermoplasmata archaeon]|nr:MAG: hypothetical protein DRN57_08530 [Thermoplasmata archaeon]